MARNFVKASACVVPDCPRQPKYRDLCSTHYSRWRKHGDPLFRVRRLWNASLEERFWHNVEKTDDCWVWRGTRSRHGYGTISQRVGNSWRRRVASRVSYALHYGPFPDELDVCHTCDNPACVRPDHLWLGDAKANGQDMARKGRSVYQRHPEKVPRGEKMPTARLTEELVTLIRNRSAQGATRRGLARELGIGASTVFGIVKGRSWRHVPWTT